MESDKYLSYANPSPIYQQPSYLKSALFFVRLCLIKSMFPLLIRIHRWRDPLLPSEEPTYIKRYPIRPNLVCEVFIPSSYKAGDRPLPLFIDVHGGGYNVCDASVDRRDNGILSQKHGICVVAIDYRKGPFHEFPKAPEDCAALINAILEDDTLPADKTKVAIGGYSAGGGLVLSASQIDKLYERIKAVVAYYPSCDFSVQGREKLAQSSVAPGKKEDLLAASVDMFQWGYVSPGTDRRNPLLSPIYAARNHLPEKIYIMGCEYDMLCPEGKATARKLATHEPGEKQEFNGDDDWQKGGVRWQLLKGLEHGFNAIPGKSAAENKERKERQLEMQAEVAKWLFKECYT